VDRGTRQKWIRALSNTPDALVLAEFMTEVMQSGKISPHFILSYNSTQFTAKTWAQLCQRTLIAKILTAYTNPQGNGITE
jgi:hypothetical protein